MSNFNQSLLDSMAITSFFIALSNYEENIKQSKNDDIMKEVDETTNMLIDKLEGELSYQNELLVEIKSKLDELLSNKESVVKE